MSLLTKVNAAYVRSLAGATSSCVPFKLNTTMTNHKEARMEMRPVPRSDHPNIPGLIPVAVVRCLSGN
jgi:hypothetical protein